MWMVGQMSQQMEEISKNQPGNAADNISTET